MKNNQVFLHSKYNETKRILTTIYLLIPFLLYGFYKNGISLYNKNIIPISKMFNPLIFVVIALGVSIIFAKIFKEKIVSYRLLTNLLISLVTFPSTNIIIYLVLIALTNVAIKYVKINGCALYMVGYSLILMLFHKYTYLNAFESSYETNYSFLDLFLGKGFGGISNTMLLFILIAFIILLITYDYKREIPIISLCIYYFVILLIGFINNNLDSNLLLNANLLFGIIFVSPITTCTPYTRGGKILDGVFLGIFLVAFSFLDINIGVYVVILLLSICHKFIDKIITH